jgi:hypothetical protein
MGRPEMDIMNQFDHVIWLGDLNYRTEKPFNEVLELYSRRDWPTLEKVDQLKREMRKHNVFVGYHEGELTFGPTYRWERKENVVSNKKNQSPSWTDRILWRSLPDVSELKQESYSSATEVFGSDHRPIFSLFKMRIRKPFTGVVPSALQRGTLNNLMRAKGIAGLGANAEPFLLQFGPSKFIMFPYTLYYDVVKLVVVILIVQFISSKVEWSHRLVVNFIGFFLNSNAASEPSVESHGGSKRPVPAKKDKSKEKKDNEKSEKERDKAMRAAGSDIVLANDDDIEWASGSAPPTPSASSSTTSTTTSTISTSTPSSNTPPTSSTIATATTSSGVTTTTTPTTTVKPPAPFLRTPTSAPTSVSMTSPSQSNGTSGSTTTSTGTGTPIAVKKMEDDGDSDDDEHDEEEEDVEPLASGIWNWSNKTEISPFIYDRQFLSSHHIMISITAQTPHHGVLGSPSRDSSGHGRSATIFERVTSPAVAVSRHSPSATPNGDDDKQEAPTPSLMAADSLGFGVISLKPLMNNTSSAAVAFTTQITHSGLIVGEVQSYIWLSTFYLKIDGTKWMMCYCFN